MFLDALCKFLHTVFDMVEYYGRILIWSILITVRQLKRWETNYSSSKFYLLKSIKGFQRGGGEALGSIKNGKPL